jgi:sulfite exporter TauE/SafE
MVLTALILGFAGSLHCLGMCSPLAIAVTSSSKTAIKSKLIYNAGRIFSYGMLGTAFAGMGFVIALAKLQFVFTILVAVFLIMMGITGIAKINIPGVTKTVTTFTNFIKIRFAKYLKQKNVRTLIILGMLNGLLPCGLTYIALGYCLTLAGPLDGLQFMLLFGIGTLPVMAGFTSILPSLMKKFNWNLGKFARFSFLILGLLVLVRLFFVQGHLPGEIGGHVSLLLCR